MSKYIWFFGSRNDLLTVLLGAEEQNPLIYVEAGYFDAPKGKPPVLVTYDTAAKIKELGSARSGDVNAERIFLIVEPEYELTLEKITLRRGGVRYSLTQCENSRSVSFRPGGIFDENCIIRGEIATISANRLSLDFMKLFRKGFKKKFEYVSPCYIGSNAAKILNEGGRLTDSVKSPKEFDLKRHS